MSAPSLSAAAPRYRLEVLHPNNFALVMATGIISIGLATLGHGALAEMLFVVAAGAWLALIALSTARAVLHARAVRDDLLSPRVVFSYFTLVAATDIVGLLLMDRGHYALAVACWVIAFLAWCALLYLAFAVLTFLTHEHNVNIVHGGWLIAIVGTQSLVLLGVRVAPVLGAFGSYMMVEVHMLWGLGLIFYGIFVTLFCYRIFFLTLRPEDVSPLLWVIMGAAAISANAGTALVGGDAGMAFLAAQRPFIQGVSMMLWAWGTWWIPLLVLFGFWKHFVARLPMNYEPFMWSLVFPLGMYAVASVRLGLAVDFQPLEWISRVMIWVALAAWLVVMTGLARRVAAWARQGGAEQA